MGAAGLAACSPERADGGGRNRGVRRFGCGVSRSACVMVEDARRHTRGHGSRAGRKGQGLYGRTGICGGPGCWHFLLWLHIDPQVYIVQGRPVTAQAGGRGCSAEGLATGGPGVAGTAPGLWTLVCPGLCSLPRACTQPLGWCWERARACRCGLEGLVIDGRGGGSQGRRRRPVWALSVSSSLRRHPPPPRPRACALQRKPMEGQAGGLQVHRGI